MKRPDWLSARKTPMGSGKPFQGRNKTRPIGCCPPPSQPLLSLCASSATPCRSASSSNSANRVRSSRLLANKVSSNRCNAAGSPPVMASSERMSKRLSIGDSEPSSFIQTPSICLKEGHCALRCPACGTPGIRRTTRPYMPSGPVIRKQHKGIASASAVQTGSIACCVSSNGPKRPWKRSWPARSLPLPADRSRPDRSFRGGKLLR